MDKFKDGDVVELLGPQQQRQGIFGRVVGTASYLRYGHISNQIVVLLNNGFYDPEKVVYVSALLVHPDNCIKAVDI